MRRFQFFLLTLLPFSLLLQAAYTVTIGQVDVSRLPEVTVYVSVTDESGQPVTNLKQEDFTLTEDGASAGITSFAGIGDERPVDVVFVFDTTGSMAEEINGVIQTCVAFAEELRRTGRDYRLGLVTFGDAVRGVYNTDGALTGDVQDFKDWMRTLSAEGGNSGPENPFGALKQASQMQFRDDAQIIFILITDAPPHHSGDWPEPEGSFDDPDLTYDRTLALLTSPRAVTVYSVTYDDAEFRNLASETGGKFYDIERNPDFTGIIDDIGEAIAAQYRLTYITPRPDYDGTRRNIRVEVGGSSSSTDYVEPHLLTIQSNWLIALACLFPLLVSLAVPPIVMMIFRPKPVVALATAAATPPPPPSPPQFAPLPLPPTARSARPPAPPAPPPAATVPCPHCGQPMRAGVKFCPHCGTSAAISAWPPQPPQKAWCTNCGEPLRTGAKFCGKCGTQV